MRRFMRTTITLLLFALFSCLALDGNKANHDETLDELKRNQEITNPKGNERNPEPSDSKLHLKVVRKRHNDWEAMIEMQLLEGLDKKLNLTALGERPGSENDEHIFSFLPVDSLSDKPSNRRLLADGNVLSQPGIIAFDGQPSSTAEYYAYQYIFTNLAQYSTQFVIYPYSFTYSPNPADSSTDIPYKNGGIFTINPDALPSDSSKYNYFRNLKTTTDVNFGKAKALYDVSMGVLSISAYFNDIYKELTYESSVYCTIMASYLGKYTNCMPGSSYLAFKNDSSNAGKSAFVYLSEVDIGQTGLLLTADGIPRFEIFIIPDYYIGAESAITAMLGPSGIKQILTYISKGGIVYASGKGGYLLEYWSVLPSGLYYTNQTLTTTDPNCVASLTGCNNTGGDFTKSLLCMNTTDANNLSYSFILSAYMMNPTNIGGLSLVMSYNNQSTSLMKKDLTGNRIPLTVSDKQFLPFMMWKQIGMGEIFLVNGNALFLNWYANIFYNFVLVAMSKNILFNAYVGSSNNLPIPAGEVGITLDVSLSFINLYDTPIRNMRVHIWFPDGIVPTVLPSGCIQDPTNVTFTVDLTGVNVWSHVICGNSLIGAFENYSAIVNIEIQDSSITQKMINILIVRVAVEYTDVETGRIYQYDVGAITTSASLAALLSCTLNPDPSSFYPILGSGDYVDNVLQVENKEDTDAIDVEYIGMVPIISPVVDGSDQTQVITAAQFLASYYNNTLRQWYYPFQNVNGENFDYLDYAWLNGKNIVLVAEWDIPVQTEKQPRTDAFPPINTDQPFDIGNMNYSTSISSSTTVLEQIYFNQSNNFYTLATQRQMVFVDTTKPQGAATMYPNGIPDGEVNPNNPLVRKKELIWTRSDLYFYPSQAYLMPTDVNYTHVISIDRYLAYNDTCVATFGKANAKIEVAGYFNIIYPDGLKPNEFSNEMLMYCNRTKVDYNDVDNFTNGSIKAIHYLVPITDPEITNANDILDFINNTDGTGYMNNYPEVKFVYAHSFHIYVSANISLQGGMFEIQLPNGVGFNNQTIDPVNQSYITYSPDQVAFYKTEFDASSGIVKAYFKRGLAPNEAYGLPSYLGVLFEELNTTDNITAGLKIYQMKYDISSAATNYETYILSSNSSINLTYGAFFSLPALEVHVKVNRTNSTHMLPYEQMDPYTRFGVYIQELKAHRTVWASAESHHTSNPGVQAINAGFSMISNLGISSIPYAQFMTTGKALLIPFSPSTSRIEWKDIWGRQWAQPLRSVFPDVPPIPPPLRNFMMSTTFELFKTGTTQRVLSWTSDEILDIRVHIKLLNNYQKYFQLTTCKDNEVEFFMAKDTMFEYERIFDNPPYSYQISTTNAPNSSYEINYGSRAVYGFCYNASGTVLEGQNVSATNLNLISTAYLCNDGFTPAQMISCYQQLSGLPTVFKRPPGNTSPLWIYSPKVDSYYPKGYITSDMWDLTHTDYEDTAMDKAYPYQMDNNLPGIDFGPSWNPARYKPHNIITQPIWKGFGFQISYSNTMKLAKFPQYSGWWSDNLQNRDNTLLAGQNVSNNVSVNKTSLLADTDWINARNLINPLTRSVITERLQNIHVCLFNQYRIRMTIGQQRYSYPANVLQNNIIPLLPDLTSNDPRLTSYDCTNVYQYTPYNISKVSNVVYTSAIRDWLYFAANLRGGALETINVPYLLQPIGGVNFEGLAKVNDGGEFVYWNPANGPNSFLDVTNPVNLVEAIRSDLTITCEVFPKATATFNAVLYHLITIQDPAEILRQWTYETYTNSYGFGDSTVQVFVGGTQDTQAIIDASQSTIVEITFFNNAGFDWNLYGNAINFDYYGAEPINANDLLFGTTHSVQMPLAYNFMILNIPDSIKSYVTIIPSDHNIDVAPQFFDFMNINVATIRDGYIGKYYYKITLASTIPDSIRGKVYTIPITINQTFFDRLPGYKDPTGAFYHDYTLQIPPIKFGIPYSSGPYAGKVFYTSGYSTNLTLSASVPSYWNVTEARLISDQQLSNLRIASGDLQNYASNLLAVWNTLTPQPSLVIQNKTTGTTTTISINMSSVLPTFPLPNGNNPDIASIMILLKANTPQLAYGTLKVISSPKISYYDCVGKQKSSIIPAPVDLTVMSKGAWLSVSYTSTIMCYQNGVLLSNSDQRMFQQDVDTIILVDIMTQNVGTDTAYHVNLTLSVSPAVQIMYNMLPAGLTYTTSVDATGYTNLGLNPGISFAAGDSYSLMVYLKVKTLFFRRLLASTTGVTFINGVSAAVDLLQAPGADSVVQSISTPLTYSVYTAPRDDVTLTVNSLTSGNVPIYRLQATANPIITVQGSSVRYLFTRQILSLTCTDDPISTSSNGKCSSIPTGTTTLNGGTTPMNIIVDSPIPSSFTGSVTGGTFFYMVQTYDQNMLLLASSNTSLVSDATGNNQNNNQGSNTNPSPGTNITNPNNQGNNQSNNNTVNPPANNKTVNNQTDNTDGGLFGGSAGSSLPLWAMIVIPSAVLVIIVVAAVLVCKMYRRVKVFNESPSISNVKPTLEGPRVITQPQLEPSSGTDFPKVEDL